MTDLSSFQQGIENLQKRLLESVIPEKTALLANYPNPFNPETWIPYHLAKPGNVTLTIYAVNGAVVRTLALGHQPAGMYQSRSRAAHWDGKNAPLVSLLQVVCISIHSPQVNFLLHARC